MAAKNKKQQKSNSTQVTSSTSSPTSKKFVLTQNNKRIIVLVSSILVLFGLLYIGKSLFIAALVNNRPVFRTKVLSELERQGGGQVLESLVNETLILQEAAKKNVTVAKDEVDTEISKLEENIKAQGSDLDTALSLQGQTRDDLFKAIQMKLMIEKVLADKLSVTEKEATDYYNNNKTALFKDKKFEDVKANITALLKDEKLQTEYQKWIQELKTNAKVQYFVNYK